MEAAGQADRGRPHPARRLRCGRRPLRGHPDRGRASQPRRRPGRSGCCVRVRALGRGLARAGLVWPRGSPARGTTSAAPSRSRATWPWWEPPFLDGPPGIASGATYVFERSGRTSGVARASGSGSGPARPPASSRAGGVPTTGAPSSWAGPAAAIPARMPEPPHVLLAIGGWLAGASEACRRGTPASGCSGCQPRWPATGWPLAGSTAPTCSPGPRGPGALRLRLLRRAALGAGRT